MTAIQVGVVGCGYWGPNLARVLHSLPGCRLACICDKDDKRLSHLKGLYPSVATYSGFDRMLEEGNLDAVVIATPVTHHFPLARQSLLAGKHVFIEKPMAKSSAECEELTAIALTKGRTLMVGHTFLYSPAVRKVKEIVESGEIGTIRYISARRLNLGLFQRDINVVWDLAPHDLSIILHLMNATPDAVNCQGSAHVAPGVEDVSNLSLTFAGGGYATVHSSWLDPKKVREMTIVGTKKMIVYDDIEPLHKIRVYDVRVDEPPHYDTFAEFHFSYHYGDVYMPYIKQEEPLKVECQHFLDCIRSGDRPLTSGEAGMSLVRILEAASKSLRQEGARVALNGGTAPMEAQKL